MYSGTPPLVYHLAAIQVEGDKGTGTSGNGGGKSMGDRRREGGGRDTQGDRSWEE